MLQNWLKSIAFENENFDTHRLGHKIQFYNKSFPKLNRVKIAIIGLEVKESNAIRSELYQLSHHFPNLRIADLGNVRKKEVSFVIPIIKELLGSGVCVILLGQQLDWIRVQQQGHRQTKKQTNNWLSIDDRIRLDANFKNGKRIIVGGQKHLTSRADLQKLEKRDWEYYSLGSCRTNLKAVEPSIREADFASFNIASLKSIEAPAQLADSPSGFFLEEACQLTHYIGMNDKLNSIGFYGFEAKKSDRRTPKAIAQLVWYFIDGVHNRKQDYPISMEEMAEYIVHLKQHDLLLTFWKSLKSGRWWMQLPDAKTENRLISCAYEDYQMAGNGEISNRLLRVLKV